MASRCALNGTVVATVAADTDAPEVGALAASAAAAGFPCVVVQPYSSRLPLSSTRLLQLLPPPRPPLLPRSRWCNGSGYAARRAQLHRTRLWAQLLGEGLGVLGVSARHRLRRNPLPAIAAMRTRAGAVVPDVLGSTPGWFMKHFYLSTPLFLRAGADTRALLAATAPRVRGADEDVVFSEELNWGAGRHAACCHTECLAAQFALAKPPSEGHGDAAAAPQPPLVDARVETAPGQPRDAPNGARCRTLRLDYDDSPPLAPPPPNATGNRWPRAADGNIAPRGAARYGTSSKGLPLVQLAWRADAFNPLFVPLHRFGRCTGRTESCVGLHATCPPPPPPFVGVAKGARRRKAPGRRRGL